MILGGSPSLGGVGRITIIVALLALVAVGSASDRLAQLMARLAPGSERPRGEPETNLVVSDPDVAPRR